jgi:molybdate transport system substrate-binding protein
VEYNVKNKLIKTIPIVLVSIILVFSLFGCSSATPVELNVSAAASLTDVLKEINALYVQENPNVTITPNFASSGTLQQQIEQGAPCDVFLSAAAAQMDNLQNGELILTDTRKNLLNNSVVLIVPVDSTLGITSFNDLATDKVTSVAIGDPKSVPGGKYAQQAFDALGITDQVQPKEILGNTMPQVLTYVETGNVEAGIVFATDALMSTKVIVVASAPAEINAKIVYPVAVIKASKNVNAAKAYIAFLFSDKAKAIFEKYGFTMVNQ